MWTIETKRLGPTNHRGERIKAMTPSRHNLTVSFDYGSEYVDNHRAAADRLFQATYGGAPDEVHCVEGNSVTGNGRVFIYWYASQAPRVLDGPRPDEVTSTGRVRAVNP